LNVTQSIGGENTALIAVVIHLTLPAVKCMRKN